MLIIMNDRIIEVISSKWFNLNKIWFKDLFPDHKIYAAAAEYLTLFRTEVKLRSYKYKCL